MQDTNHSLSHARQASARLVSRLMHAEAELKKVFALQKDDPAALRRALRAATDAGLTDDISREVQKVRKHLEQAMPCVCVGCAYMQLWHCDHSCKAR